MDAYEIKQQVSIVDLLAHLGFQPKKKSGNEFFYLSMLRDSDTSPSLTVNDNLGTWYDHGMGKGGTVIDLCMTYWKSDFKETLKEISRILNLDITLSKPVRNVEKTRPRKAVKLPNYKVEEVKDLGNHLAITNYLKQRGVWDVAFGRLKEVYYYVMDEKKQKKDFFAAGWQNENGGWEVRNKYFKGCLGRKGMTFIPGNEHKLVVFEGYLDYLSWLFEHKKNDDSVLVLNSVVFLSASITRARRFSDVSIFFDHDKSGREATATFQGALPDAQDQSYLYRGYNDYNEKIQAEIQRLLKLEEPKPAYMANLKVGFCR